MPSSPVRSMGSFAGNENEVEDVEIFPDEKVGLDVGDGFGRNFKTVETERSHMHGDSEKLEDGGVMHGNHNFGGRKTVEDTCGGLDPRVTQVHASGRLSGEWGYTPQHTRHNTNGGPLFENGVGSQKSARKRTVSQRSPINISPDEVNLGNLDNGPSGATIQRIDLNRSVGSNM
ncbi:hypothetical protein Hanom_Chr12g01096441 [Helianthus anomalus]